MKNYNLIILLMLLCTALLSRAALAHQNIKHNTDVFEPEREVVKVVQEFHQALKKGKENRARQLLDDNVIIFEGGGIERSADEYASHHMKADIKYLAAIDTQVLEHKVEFFGELAYSMSRTQASGEYKGKLVDYQGMETMVLRKIKGQWKIVHIHWSN